MMILFFWVLFFPNFFSSGLIRAVISSNVTCSTTSKFFFQVSIMYNKHEIYFLSISFVLPVCNVCFSTKL